ncbi:hypothetical protein BK133_26810 [Paenibacillus sp. FSL H8-0548]|nr:hypothetical protein BK133_26810 [Paenibacillus sp. FSL H8-0548]
MLAKMVFFHHTTREKGFRVGPHQHHSYELVYYLDGGGQAVIEEHSYPFHDNSFTVIRPGSVHDEVHTTDSQVMFIGFHVAPHIHIPTGFFAEEVHQGNYPILSLLLQMKAEFINKQPLYQEKLNLLTSEIVIELCRRFPPKNQQQLHTDPLHYVRNYMDEHYQQALGIEELAALAGYSYDRFRHLFKEKTGLSPQKYLLNHRITHASQLLQHTKLPINEIALDAGFSTAAQFCHFFKRELGITPRQHRLAHLQT